MLTITAIREYPVKSLAGYALEQAILTSRGLENDRRWMLIDEEGRFITQREHPWLCRKQARLQEDTLILTDLDSGAELRIPEARAVQGPLTRVHIWDDSLDARLVATDIRPFFGQPWRLVYMADDCQRIVDQRYAKPGQEVGFSDGYPYLITNETSLARLAEDYGEPLSMGRFRPNIVVRGARAFAEDQWRSLQHRGGSFLTPKPCARCVMITVDPANGSRQKRVLTTLAAVNSRDNQVIFGANACWEGPSPTLIKVGDILTDTSQH
jgi:uncharacterized protein YcbX